VNIDSIGGDFNVYLNAMNHFFSNNSIYNTTSSAPFLYPPLSLIIFFPFHFIDNNKDAVILWYIISNIIIFLSAIILYNALKGYGSRNAFFSLIMCFCFSMPLYHCISVGNANILIFWGFCIIYWGVCYNKSSIIPLTLAILTFLKIFPAIFLLVLFRYKMWQEIFAYMFFMVIGLSISLVIFGINDHIYFVKHLTSALHFVGPLNISFTVILKLFLPYSFQPYIIFINLLFSLLVLGIWIFATKNLPNSQMIADLMIIQVILLLIISYSWYQYYMFLIIPFSFILCIQLQNIRKGFKYFSVFLIPFFLINLWEILIYQIPLTYDKLTAFMIFENPYQYPVLYKVIASVPFCLNILIFSFLLLNYKYLTNFLLLIKNELPQTNFGARK
jgi:hypothetical protein